MACPTPFDVFRARTEMLGPQLYKRASWKTPILNVIPRETYPGHATGGNSVFTVYPSGPTSADETWYEVTTVDQEGNPCDNTFAGTEVGFKEIKYFPESYFAKGILLCRNDLPLNWNTVDFWMRYFEAMDKRFVKSIVNRQFNVYMHFVPKVACTTQPNFAWADGDYDLSAPPPSGGGVTPCPDLTDITAALLADPCELLYDHLNQTALDLMYANADQEDSDGWITDGEQGPLFPILIGPEIAKRLFLNNEELRQDVRDAYNGLKEANPLLRRLGATGVLGNFRFVINRFPPRWNITLQGTLERVPSHTMSEAVVTKGSGEIVNPDYLTADCEGAVVLNPWVMTEQILQPTNAMPNAKFDIAANYMGEWVFRTGIEALHSDDCGISDDPFHNYGRHFAQYWHANKPIHPEYGRLLVWRRCEDSWTCPDCASEITLEPQ